MESAAWADLPADLLRMISDCLQEAFHINRIRAVCRSWRSSVTPIQTKHRLSPLFPRSLSSCTSFNATIDCVSRPQYLIANSVLHLRSTKFANWIVYVQESEPGKLLLHDALTCEPIRRSSGCRLDMSGWRLTPLISIFHRFSTPTCGCTRCYMIAKTKVVFVDDDDSEPMAVFEYYHGLYALRRFSSTDAGQLVTLRGAASIPDFVEFVSFNGCLYVVDDRSVVFVLDRTSLQLLPLTCVDLLDARCASCFGKRFVVSDGDLYLVFSYCMRPMRHEILVYKFVMGDINTTSCYRMEKVENLGERVFIINKDCSFSVLARDLAPPLVGNCVIVARCAFAYCYCSSGFRVYHLGGKPVRMVRHLYPALFEPPSLWNHQLQRKRRRASWGVVSNHFMKNNPPTSAVRK